MKCFLVLLVFHSPFSDFYYIEKEYSEINEMILFNLKHRFDRVKMQRHVNRELKLYKQYSKEISSYIFGNHK